MYHIVYLTTNIVNQKMYVGVHSTYNLNDGYLGKGIAIKKSVQKYGRSKFKRQILHFCLTREDAFALEEQIVDTSFVLRQDTYNLTVGGVLAYDHTKHPNRETFKHIYSENARNGYKNMSDEKKELVKSHRKETLSQPHIKQLHKNNTKIGMENMPIEDKERMKQNMRGNNNNKRKWLLKNTLGQEFVIDDLKKFCIDVGVSYSFIFYTLKRNSKPRFWSIVKLDV